MSDYGILGRALHRMMLGSTAVAETGFSIDQALSKARQPADVGQGRHVFVSGLARAGTTALMRRIHAGGAFRSLTYADMPFVLAPNLWSMIRGGRVKRIEAGERAHGDGVIVDAESPESLDEVFWRIFDGESYIRPDRLLPHDPDTALTDRFTAYVGAILASSGDRRYLSKNNNNVLRLPALARTFPNAVILVPFRAPMDHAGSLLSQHRRFGERHASDAFSANYMRWLVHHEFGGDHRPFATHDLSEHAPDTLAYWLDQWIGVHTHLLRSAPETAQFVCYEDLCDDAALWPALAARLGIDAGAGSDAPFVRAAARPPGDPLPAAQLARAGEIYATLRQRARAPLRAAA